MQKAFNTYFKKSSKSSSPLSRFNQFAKNHNIFQQSRSPRSPIQKSNLASPPTLPEIATEIQINTKKVLGTDLYDYTTKVVDIIDQIETAKLRRNHVKQVHVEKNEAILINKYRNIREKCLNNEIKTTHLLNELKEEVRIKRNSEKSLAISLEIIESFSMTYNFNGHNPLEYVKEILQKFCYLHENDLIKTIVDVCSFENRELKNMPLLFIIEKMCGGISNLERKHKEMISNLRNEIQSLKINNQELKDVNMKSSIRIKNSESEANILRDKELASYKDKVYIN